MTFHGLASPNELKTTWFNMTEGQDLPDVNVIWEFDENALNNVLESSFGCYVVNCLYKVNPNMIGHYIALYKKENSLIYFDPLATFPQKWFIDCCFNKPNLKLIVDLEGAQAINGNSCGFRCLFKLLKYCLGYMPENYAELFENRIDWYITRNDKKKALHAENVKRFINTTIKKTKREIETIKNVSNKDF